MADPKANDPLPPTMEEAAAGLDLTRPTYASDVLSAGAVDVLSTQAEVANINRANAHAGRTYWGYAKDIADTSFTADILHYSRTPNFEADPNFTLKDFEARFKMAQETLPEDWWPTLGRAVSGQHFDFLYRHAMEKVDTHKRLAEGGWGGWTAQQVAGFFDPASLVAGIGVGGAAVKFARSAQLGQAGWIGSQAAAGGALVSGIELSRKAMGEGISNETILYSAGLGLAIGAGFGTLMRNPNTVGEAATLVKAGQGLQQLAQMGVERYKTFRPNTQAGIKRAEVAASEAKPIAPAEAPPAGPVEDTLAGQVAKPLEGSAPPEKAPYIPGEAPAAEPSPVQQKIQQTVEAVLEANKDIVPPEAAQSVRQAIKTLLPEPVTAPASKPEVSPELAQARSTGQPVELPSTPDLLKNTRFIARYMGPDGFEYRIMAQTDDLTGPYVLRRAHGSAGQPPVGRDFASVRDALGAIPKAGTVEDAATQVAMAQLEQAKPLPGKLEGTEIEGYRFRGYRYVLDASSGKDQKVFNAMRGEQQLGYIEISKQPDGRWKISMIEVEPEFRKSPAAFGLLKVAEKVNEGAPIIPDGTLLQDGYAHWVGRLQWVKDWYRPIPENPAWGWASPKQLLSDRDFIKAQLQEPKLKPAERTKFEGLLKKYDAAIDTLPPEATLPENLRQMFKLGDREPGRGLGTIRPGAREAVVEVLERTLPADVNYKLMDTIPVGTLGIPHQATALWSSAEKLVYIALSQKNPVVAAYHESLHALRQLGYVRPGEWKSLVNWAYKSGSIERHDIKRLYGDLLDQTAADMQARFGADPARTRTYFLEEEAVAHALSEHAAGIRYGGLTERIFDKIVNVFRSIRDALGIRGFRTLQDVFEEFKSGQMAQRNPNSPPTLDQVVRASLAPTPPETRPFLNDGLWETVKQEDAPRPAKPLGLFRLDRAGRSGDTDNAAARLVSSVLMNDTVGKHDNSVNPFSADIDARRIKNVYMGEYDRHRMTSLKEWADDLKLGPVERMARADEFYREVGMFVADRREGYQYHPAVEKLGLAVRRILDDIRQQWQNPLRFPFSDPKQQQLIGRPIEGSQNLTENTKYLWRKLDHRQMLGAVDRFGESGVVQMVKNAIRSAQPDIDDAVLAALSKGYVRSAYKRAAGLGDEWSIALGEGNRNRLQQLLSEDGTLTQDQISNILDRLYKTGEGETTNLKRRVLLDEAYIEKDLPTTDGGTDSLSFRDLLDNNVNNLLEGYLRRASGRIALGRVRIRIPERATEPGKVSGGETLIDGLTTNAEIEGLLSKVAAWGADNVPGYSPQRDMEYLRFAFDRILGIPDSRQMTNLAQVLRDLRKFNVTRLMGQVGIAQFGESGHAVASLGLKASFRHVPGLKRIISATGEAKLNDPLFAELEGIGVGVERLHGMHYHNLDEVGELPFEVRPTSRHDRISRDLGLAEKATYEASGMSFIQQQQERAVAAGIAQKFSDMAIKFQAGKGLGKGDLRRFAQLGIDEPMAERMFKQFQHADTTDGLFFPNKLSRLNLHKWDDLEARSAFENAVFRYTSKLIQAGDLGSNAVFMSDPLWQTLLQFRSFTFTAWQNQFLYNLHMKDFAAFNSFTWSVAWNAAVRAAQVQLLSIGRSDRDKYLEKHASPWELAKAGFQRSGWTSLIPAAVDTGLVFAGQEGMFNARTSGQPSDAFLGSPIISAYNQGMKGIGGLIGSQIDGRTPSQGEVRNAASLLPFQNMMPFAQLLSTMIGDLPEHSPRKPKH